MTFCTFKDILEILERLWTFVDILGHFTTFVENFGTFVQVCDHFYTFELKIIFHVTRKLMSITTHVKFKSRLSRLLLEQAA